LTGIAVNGAPNLAERFPTQAAVDSMIRAETASALKLADANDILYQFSASSGYDAWPALDRINVPVLWWDSADDFITPRLCRTRPWPSSECRTFVTSCCRPARKPTVI
jgi:pimeloyl-ACP methyl ester carboxylesterase